MDMDCYEGVLYLLMRGLVTLNIWFDSRLIISKCEMVYNSIDELHNYFIVFETPFIVFGVKKSKNKSDHMFEAVCSKSCKLNLI